MVEIRKYMPEDKSAVQQICVDTSPSKIRFKPKGKLAIPMMFAEYYLDYEPENCFVTVDDGKVCGYIVCSTNKDLYQEKMKNDIMPKIKKLSFFLYLFTKICVHTSKKTDDMFGSGGFHMNIDSEHQGQHLGVKLLDTLAEHLKQTGAKSMYLITKNRKTRGYGFYTHYGFKEAKKLTFGTLALTFDVQNNIKQ